MAISDILKVRSEALSRQIQSAMDFATSPKGVFETMDEITKRFREANIRTLESLKLRW